MADAMTTATELSEQVKAAVWSFTDGDDDWQAKFATCLMAAGEHMDAGYLLPPDPMLSVVLRMVARAFDDAAVGTINPLFEVSRKPGRPTKNAADRVIASHYASVVGLLISGSRSRGWTREECYKRGAALIRNHGGKATWTQMRSAWVNRERLGATAVQHLETLSRYGSSNHDWERWADQHAELAAFQQELKHPLF